MDWLGSRDVKVKVDLTTPATDEHLAAMMSAANDLTNDRKSVRVYADQGATQAVFAEFTIVGVKQDQAAGVVMDHFNYVPDYSDQTVWFPTRERRRRRRSSRSR